MAYNSSDQTKYLDVGYTSALETAGVDWAMMFWIKTADGGTNPIMADRFTYPPLNGWNHVLTTAGTSISYTNYSGGSVTFTRTEGIPDIIDGGLHHFAMVCDNSANILYFYVDGVLDNSVGSYVDPAATSQSLTIFNQHDVPAYTQGLKGIGSDFRLYTSQGWTAARDSIIKSIYESEGNDDITDGLVVRANPEGPDGSTITVVPNLGNSGGSVSIGNSPVYAALELNGR